MIGIIDLFIRAGLGVKVKFAKELWGDESPQYFEGRAEVLSRAFGEYAKRFPQSSQSVPALDERGMAETLDDNPHKVKAFLQALEETNSPALLVMVWRIIHGDSISALEMSYKASQNFRLRVQLEEPETGHTSPYDSDEIEDARLLRHLGIVNVNQQPVFTGFFPHID